MILADSVIWIAHFRTPDPLLFELLDAERILCHPFIIGEIAVGNLRDRKSVLADLRSLPPVPVATFAEVAALIEWGPLHGAGIGYVDAHLLASARLLPGTVLWTRDVRLARTSARFGIASEPDR